VGQDVAVERRAAAQIALILGQQARQVDGQRRRERLRARALGLLVDLAVDRRRALADAARVEADDVEALVERVEQPLAGRGLQVVDLGAAGAAEVEEQRADAMRLILRRHARDRDPDGLAARLVVVEGHGLNRALHDGAGNLAAVLPLKAVRSVSRGSRRRDQQ
jgi:hypothetical protein